MAKSKLPNPSLSDEAQAKLTIMEISGVQCNWQVNATDVEAGEGVFLDGDSPTDCINQLFRWHTRNMKKRRGLDGEN